MYNEEIKNDLNVYHAYGGDSFTIKKTVFLLTYKILFLKI